MDRKQRHRQLGRIHAAKRDMGLADAAYRDLLEALTGERSCRELSDRQVNHVLDWLNYLSGRRGRRPAFFGRLGRTGDGKANLAALCHALCGVVPDGYEVSPMQSDAWRRRTCGGAGPFEELNGYQLTKLIEGFKAISRRREAGAANTEGRAHGGHV